MPISSAAGLRLQYELSGEGSTPLVLIHEIGGSLRSWDPMVAVLEGNFRVLRYDLRGAGRSEHVRDPYTMDDLANDLEALVTDSGLASRFLIAGAAGGSAVAVTYAARYPARVRGLILCPPALSVTPERRRYLTERSDLAVREGMAAIVDRTLGASFPSAVIRNPIDYDRYRSCFLESDPISYALANRALAESTADRLAASVRCPALLLAGTHDPLRPPAHVQAVASTFANAAVEEVDSAHIMAQQAPSELARLIVRLRDETD